MQLLLSDVGKQIGVEPSIPSAYSTGADGEDDYLALLESDTTFAQSAECAYA